MPWPSNQLGSFDRALMDNPEGAATLIAIGVDPIQRLSTWPADVVVTFQDAFISEDTAPVERTFTPMGGLASYAFPDPTSPVANDPFHLAFLDTNNDWINRFRQRHRGIKVSAWLAVWSGAAWVGPQLRWHGWSARVSQTPTTGGVLTQVECRGPFHQTSTALPEVLSDESQIAVDPDDNSKRYVSSIRSLPWGFRDR